LHPGQTGGSHALVIAGQLTAGDPEAKPPVPQTGWILEIDEGVARLRLLDSAGKVIRAQAPYHKPVKAGTWNHLTFTYDGSRTENGYAFYMNGARMPIERGAYGGQDSTIAVELQESVTNTAPITLGAAANGEKGLDGSVGEFRVFDRVINEEEARLVAACSKSARIRQRRRICCFGACTINRASCWMPRRRRSCRRCRQICRGIGLGWRGGSSIDRIRSSRA
jgi:hypothetical protein